MREMQNHQRSRRKLLQKMWRSFVPDLHLLQCDQRPDTPSLREVRRAAASQSKGKIQTKRVGEAIFGLFSDFIGDSGGADHIGAGGFLRQF